MKGFSMRTIALLFSLIALPALACDFNQFQAINVQAVNAYPVQNVVVQRVAVPVQKVVVRQHVQPVQQVVVQRVNVAHRQNVVQRVVVNRHAVQRVQVRNENIGLVRGFGRLLFGGN